MVIFFPNRILDEFYAKILRAPFFRYFSSFFCLAKLLGYKEVRMPIFNQNLPQSQGVSR